MGANAQTSVPAFVTGQVLTAQQQTEINTGIPVFATSVERDAAFGGTGEKVLAEGQYAFLEDTNATQFYDGSTWQPVGVSALTLIKTQAVGTAVSTVVVTDAFSATYDNYFITYDDGSAGGNDISMRMGATVTNYYVATVGNTYSGTANNAGSTAATAWNRIGFGSATSSNFLVHVSAPFLAQRTAVYGFYLTTGSGNWTVGMLDNTTSYTDFTLLAPGATLTGGTIRVYGYQNS